MVVDAAAARGDEIEVAKLVRRSRTAITLNGWMSTLEAWLAQNEVYLHPALEIQRDGTGRSSVHAVTPLPQGTLLARIPKQAVLSVASASRNCPPPPADLPAPVRLAIVVLQELWNPGSRWHGYLASLPSVGPLVATTWPSQSRARVLSSGGTLDLVLRHASVTLELLETVFETHVAQTSASFEDFLRCYRLVSSRAFVIDYHHLLALVPVADLFDHSDSPHTHLQAEEVVCPTCGSLEWRDCSHTISQQPLGQSPQDCCEMWADEDVAVGEVFNTYGELSNAELVAHYGFRMEANEHDRLVFAEEEVAPSLQATDQEAAFRAFVAASAAVAVPGLVSSVTEAEASINSDAEISPFFLWLVVVEQGADPEFVWTQLDGQATTSSKRVAARVLAICEARLQYISSSETPVDALLEAADKEDDPDAKVARLLSVDERVTLECTVQAWQTV